MAAQDLYLVIGLILVAFSIPSILGAWSEKRAPRVAAIVLVIGGAMLIYALSRGSYTFDDIPRAFVRVVAYFTR